ncbi:hypothetical protein GGF42_004905 [Coemansia sp. RSA 2424]|nr:hypothetical protein GGF42_004905 [Coemansia sp. RSA 2424]
MPSELPAAVQSDEFPGSYAYRRRGSSFLDNSGTVSSSNSSIASPALPATPKEYNWPASAMPHSQMYSGHAPGHLAYGQHQHQHQSTLCRNNTTKTVSHNDLAADHHGNNYHAAAAAGSSAGYVRHLSPSRSATFAASASSPREYQCRAYGYQSPVRDNSICTLVEHGNAAVNEITATQRKSERPGDVCDDVDVDVPNVCTIGKQFAYLPPRTANFSITN